MNTPTLDEAARARTRLHQGHASQRILGPDHDKKGVAGEIAFGTAFNLPVDYSQRSKGDGGKDFGLALGNVDVKTAVTPKCLPVEVGKCKAPIYVLAGYRKGGSAYLVGWEWGDIMRLCPKRRLMEGGPLNHCKEAYLLRPMRELRLYEAMAQARKAGKI